MLDQAEELFVGCPQEQMKERALAVARLLAEARNRGGVSIHLLVAVRNDYFGHLELLKPELPEVLQHGQLLLPLESAAARDALVKPFRRRGLSLTPALVQAIEHDLRDAEHKTSPFELQLICQALYERAGGRTELDLDLYTSRGAGRILGSYLGNALARLKEEGKQKGGDGQAAQAEALSLLRALLGAEGLRAPALPFAELAQRQRLPEETLRARLEWLVNARLVRSDTLPGESQVAAYRLAHDLLAQDLHASLSEQQKKDQDTLDDLRHRAGLWQADGQPPLHLRREQCEHFLKWQARQEHLEPRVATYLAAIERQIAWEQRQLRRQRAWRIGLRVGVPLLLLSVSAVAVLLYQGRRDAQAQVAETRAEQLLERDPAQALAWIAEAARLRGGFLGEPERSFDEHWLLAREAWERGLGWVAMRHKHQVLKVAFSPPAPTDQDCPDCWPRRKLLASAGEDGQVLLLDLEQGGASVPLCPEGPNGRQPCVAHQGAIPDLAFSPDGRWLATCGQDSVVRVWDARNRRLLHQHVEPHTEWSALAVSPDGAWLAAGDGNGGPLLVWDLRAWGEPRRYPGHRATIKKLAFAPRPAGLLASGAADGTLSLTEVAGAVGAPRSLSPPLAAIVDLAFSPDGHWLAAVGGSVSGQNIALFSAPFTGSDPPQTLDSGGGTAVQIIFSPSSRFWATGDQEGQVQLWEPNAAQSRRRAGHSGPVWALDFSRDGRWIASAGDDGLVQLTYWRGAWQRRLAGHIGRTITITFSPDGRLVTSGGVDGAVRLWPAASGRTSLHLHASSTIRAVAAIGDRIAAGIENGQAVVWPAGEIDPAAHVSTEGSVRGLCAQGDYWVLASEDGTLRTLQAPAGTEVARVSGQEPVASLACAVEGTRYTGHAAAVRKWRPGQAEPTEIGHHRDIVFGLALSPDGQRLASVSKDGTAVLWDPARREALHTLDLKQPLWSAVWLDEYRIALGSVDGQVRCWNPQTGAATPLGQPHTTNIYGLALSLDRRWLASAGGDGLRLLSVRTQAWRALSGHIGAVSSVHFTQDRLLSGGSDHSVRSYALPPAERGAFAQWMEAHLPLRIQKGQAQEQPLPPLTESFAGPAPPPLNAECVARCRQQLKDGDLQAGTTLDDCLRTSCL